MHCRAVSVLALLWKLFWPAQSLASAKLTYTRLRALANRFPRGREKGDPLQVQIVPGNCWEAVSLWYLWVIAIAEEWARPLVADEGTIVGCRNSHVASSIIHGTLQVVPHHLPLGCIWISIDQIVFGTSVLGQQHSEDRHRVDCLQNLTSNMPSTVYIIHVSNIGTPDHATCQYKSLSQSTSKCLTYRPFCCQPQQGVLGNETFVRFENAILGEDVKGRGAGPLRALCCHTPTEFWAHFLRQRCLAGRCTWTATHSAASSGSAVCSSRSAEIERRKGSSLLLSQMSP